MYKMFPQKRTKALENPLNRNTHKSLKVQHAKKYTMTEWAKDDVYHQLYMLLRHILCKYKMFPQKNEYKNSGNPFEQKY